MFIQSYSVKSNLAVIVGIQNISCSAFSVSLDSLHLVFFAEEMKNEIQDELWLSFYNQL